MNFKTIAPAALIAAALLFGTAGTSDAKGKKAAEPQQTAFCMTAIDKPVCGTRSGAKFTYANSCYAVTDGAKVAACKAGKKKSAMKKASKKKKS